MKHRTIDSPILGIYDAAVALTAGDGNIDELRGAIERAEIAVRESTCREYAVELYDTLKEIAIQSRGECDPEREAATLEAAEALLYRIERKP